MVGKHPLPLLITLFFMLNLTLSACFYDSRKDAHLPDLTGRWQGAVQDSVSGRGTLTLDLERFYKEKNGKPLLRGTWRISFADTSREGQLKGEGAFNGLTLRLGPETSCSYDLQASVLSGVIEGTYRTNFCTSYALGTLELARQ